MNKNTQYKEKLAQYETLLEKKIALKEKMIQLEKENFGILASFLEDMESDFLQF
ncbi:hypothetical protein KKD70_02540 [Patescibacteria group bacterium]|nr:hypothetical protein [Patescibacteria group bacterium]